MKFTQLIILSSFFTLLSLGAMAQAGMKNRAENKSQASGGFKRFLTKTPWTFGISGHVVDDDGQPFKGLFDVNKSWNFLYYPTRITIDGYYKAGFSFQTEFAYTQYKSGKIVNGETIKSAWTFFSADQHVKFDLNEVIGPTNWFDPYVAAGYGFTLRTGAPKPATATFNMGLGFNIWIYENLGFNAQSMAKFAMIEGTSNYLHHSVGIIYRIQGSGGARPGRLGKRYKFVGKTSRK